MIELLDMIFCDLSQVSASGTGRVKNFSSSGVGIDKTEYIHRSGS